MKIRKQILSAAISTQHMLMEEDNLVALRKLHATHREKIQFIYIDPPYGTGSSFVYNDTFHGSAWADMMHPRLAVAHQLMTDDGVILVSIDHNEVRVLQHALEDIFGRHNYLGTFIWVSNLKGRQLGAAGPAGTHEYILCFAKDIKHAPKFTADIRRLRALMPSVYKGTDYEVKNDELGPYVTKNELYNTNSKFNEQTAKTMVFNIHHNFSTGETRTTSMDDPTTFDGFDVIPPHPNAKPGLRWHAWRWCRKKVVEDTKELDFQKVGEKVRIFTKVRDVYNTTLKDLIIGPTTSTGKDDMKKLGMVRTFDTPKPVALIKILIEAASKPDSIVLDFFAGSGTTAQAVVEQNAEDGGSRRFILVQAPDPPSIVETLKERLHKCGITY